MISRKPGHTDDSAIQSRGVILFAKAPVPGRVKTRLTPRISPYDAALLYQSFIMDIRDMLAGLGVLLRVYFDEPNGRDALADLIGDGYPYFPQTGKDLGEKMANALQQTFDDGIDAAVLIGSDFPDLPGALITDALAALSESPAVIGPGVDGGYYLIGFTGNAFCPAVFDDIHWGSSHVLEETLTAFSRREIDMYMLPPWRDIDTFDDLMYFIHKNAATPENAPYTFKCLKTMGLWE